MMNKNNAPDQTDMDDGVSRFNQINPLPQNEMSSEQEKINDSSSPLIEKFIPNRPIEGVSTTHPRKKKKHLFLWFFLAIFIMVLFFTPFRVTTLILGIDRPPKDTWIGRSDTMILTTLPPVLPQVSMLSIPRDLWVPISGVGENRINAAHYFAELYSPGTGMQVARDVVEQNFGVQVDYVVRLKFNGFVDVVDALGGVTVNLPSDMSGMTAGKHKLDGTEALKFVRDRSGSDDFSRQQHGQLFVSAAFKELLNPLKWPRIPAVIVTALKAVETDLPIWLWPRMIYGFVFSGVTGFASYTFDRSALTPWTTNEGAQVLLPNWDLMNPVIDGLFK